MGRPFSCARLGGTAETGSSSDRGVSDVVPGAVFGSTEGQSVASDHSSRRREALLRSTRLVAVKTSVNNVMHQNSLRIMPAI